MSISQADKLTQINNFARIYHGFDLDAEENRVAVAWVDQSGMHVHPEFDSILPIAILGSREQLAWAQHGADHTRRLHWLMGRLAAKKAIRNIMSDTYASEIEILNAEDGSPYCSYSAPVSESPMPPSLNVSIAHTDGLAVAAASHSPFMPGIDVERVDRYDSEFPKMAFSDNERAQVEKCVGAINAAILTRVWTAKEAAGKAAQLGLGQILKRCRFIECTPDLSVITLTLTPAPVQVRTVQEQDFFIALAVL
jgi:phosphopantetheinyl transferase (holo-ACP synthase)